MCRFLMNVMLASGGYDWVVITTDKRAEYMAALESASVKGDILPFARFVISMIQFGSGVIKIPPNLSVSPRQSYQ